MKWTKGAREGILVAGGQNAGSGLAQLHRPNGIVVDQLGTVYVSDYDNHRIMRWSKGAAQGSIVAGGNGRGAQSNQFDNPTGLAFDRQGNLYVLDYGNQRVQKFTIDPTSIF
jgi:sugar lactone lactonase YvrE